MKHFLINNYFLREFKILVIKCKFKFQWYSKKSRSLFMELGCFDSKCRFNLLGFREVDANTSEHRTHCGFSSPLDFIKVKPNFKYASSCFIIFFGGIINLEEIDKIIFY